MIRLCKVLVFVVVLLMVVVGCKKYDYGPTFSLRSKKARVVGNWVTDKWMLDKYSNSAVLDSNRRVEFTKEGVYRFHKTNPTTSVETTLEGTWAFKQEKEQLLLGLPTGINGGMSYVLWDIICLKNKALWLEMVEYGYPHSTIYEWHLKAE